MTLTFDYFQVLQLADLRADEMDMVEINEAFSVVALANIMVIISEFCFAILTDFRTEHNKLIIN